MNYNSINVKQYDADREIPAIIQMRVIKFILKKFPIDKYPLLFEPGIGTGRWAIPFANEGYSVFGVDISEKMLNELKEKLSDNINGTIRFELGNIYSINSPTNNFDLCLVSHLFHLIDDSEMAVAEIVRVLKEKQGVLIHIKSGKGNSIPELSKLYVELLGEYGLIISSFNDKVKLAFQLLKEKGYSQTDIVKRDLSWINRIKLSDGVMILSNRSFSFTNIADRQTHLEILDSIVNKCLQKYGSIEKEVEVHNQIKISIFQRD